MRGRELCQAVNSKEHQKKQMLQVGIVSDTLAAARATTAATAALWHFSLRSLALLLQSQITVQTLCSLYVCVRLTLQTTLLNIHSIHYAEYYIFRAAG